MPAALVLPTPQSLSERIGQELAVTDWFEVTQERIQRFAEAIEDRQWIHLDRERAQRESPYRTTVAHGFLTLSLLSYLMKQAVQITDGVRLSINYGLNHVRFPAPVPAGAKIRARFSVKSTKNLADALEAVYLVTVEVQGGDKPCCVAEWIGRYYR